MSAIPTVTLYGERGTAVVNEADAQSWLDAGWSREPFKPAEKQTSDQTSGQTSAPGSRKSGGK
jgi:hypothetical protein